MNSYKKINLTSPIVMCTYFYMDFCYARGKYFNHGYMCFKETNEEFFNYVCTSISFTCT